MLMRTKALEMLALRLREWVTAYAREGNYRSAECLKEALDYEAKADELRLQLA